MITIAVGYYTQLSKNGEQLHTFPLEETYDDRLAGLGRSAVSWLEEVGAWWEVTGGGG